MKTLAFMDMHCIGRVKSESDMANKFHAILNASNNFPSCSSVNQLLANNSIMQIFLLQFFNLLTAISSTVRTSRTQKGHCC